MTKTIQPFSSAQRHLVPELMDDPDLDPVLHQQALRGLTRINRLSNSAGILLKPILAHARLTGQVEYQLLDIACGAGDVCTSLVKRAAARGITLHLTAADISQTALDHARENASKAGVEMQTLLVDLLDQDSPMPDFDLITNTLFLHHLTEEQTRQILRKIRKHCKQLLVINDLHRTRLGFLMASVGVKVLSRSPIVHFDGPQSVRAAYSSKELKTLCEEANLSQAQISSCWPARLLLTWTPSYDQPSEKLAKPKQD